jgi:hypothetical protein
MIKFKQAILASLAFVLVLAAPAATAGAIVTGTWYDFLFGASGSDLTAGFGGGGSTAPPAAPWTITLAGPAYLIVTDCCQPGDRFELFDFGVSLGLTSAVATSAGFECGTPDTCLADPLMSHGVFLLGAGSHSLTGIVTDSPHGGGEGFFRIAVPEPGSAALIGLALGIVAVFRRRSLARQQ